MEGLRWTLAIVTVLSAIAWLLLFSWGNGFRGSFGASKNSGGLVLIPLLVMGILIGSLLLPEQKVFLHAAAVVVVLMALLSLLLLPKFSGAGLIGLTYCGLWLVYYGLAI
jgi:hypothetical protein